MGVQRNTGARAERKRRRELSILGELVEEHIESGGPVGSKTIAQRLRGKLSSATIRSVLNELDARGLLTQPHTSAGRIPTDLGYRVYLDQVMSPTRLRQSEREAVARLGADDTQTTMQLLRETAAVLAQALGAAGVILAPPLEESLLQHIDFVFLRPGSVLAIVVTRTGLVHERLLSVDKAIDRRALEHFVNYLNEQLPGRSLVEVRRKIEEQQRLDEAALSELERQALEMGRRALEDAEGLEMMVDGTAEVLRYDEFAMPGRAAALVRALEARATWLDLLSKTVEAEDATVYVGEELATKDLDVCAIVSSSYRGPVSRGVVAVLGPRRLDYRHAVPLVGLVADRLERVLGGGEG